MTKASSIRESFAHQVISQNLNKHASFEKVSLTKPASKMLIIMDEVDGVGGGDRGGLQALL